MIVTAAQACGPQPGLRDVAPNKPTVIRVDPYSGTWGHLAAGRQKWLAQMEPGNHVSVCGDSESALSEGLSQWSDAAGRSGSLKVDSECDLSAERVIKVVGTETSESQRRCATFPKAAALTYVEQGLVVVCENGGNLQAIMLHEAGHLWGMCDVYPQQLAGSGNCDSRFFTGASRKSVMGASYESVLSNDDKAGIKALIERRDIGGNGKWSQVKTIKVHTGQER